MIPPYLLPLANHLWQSSLFAGVAGLMTLVFRRHRASLRCWLWLTASVKFLVLFSLLVSIGSQLKWRAAFPIAQVPLSSWMGEVSEPFALPAPYYASLAPVSHAPSQIPAILLGVWLSGAALAAFYWLREWLRIRAVARAASPVGRRSIRVMSSGSLLEPCVFGILRPMLLLPDGIADHLTPEQLEAIVLHELCHARRRDNLAAALHMLVETIFWFHPLVYWIGRNWIDERETACDEEVLRATGSPEVYARGILTLSGSVCSRRRSVPPG